MAGILAIAAKQVASGSAILNLGSIIIILGAF
jgi:hypothetical protein